MTGRLSPLVPCAGPNGAGCSSKAKVTAGQICGECAFELHGSTGARRRARRGATPGAAHITTKGS